MLEKLNCGIRDENSGVGLLNVKQRIESLRGTGLVIESKLGRGTKIVITIPRNILELNGEGQKESGSSLFHDKKAGKK